MRKLFSANTCPEAKTKLTFPFCRFHFSARKRRNSVDSKQREASVHRFGIKHASLPVSKASMAPPASAAPPKFHAKRGCPKPKASTAPHCSLSRWQGAIQAHVAPHRNPIWLGGHPGLRPTWPPFCVKLAGAAEGRGPLRPVIPGVFNCEQKRTTHCFAIRCEIQTNSIGCNCSQEKTNKFDDWTR